MNAFGIIYARAFTASQNANDRTKLRHAGNHNALWFFTIAISGSSGKRIRDKLSSRSIDLTSQIAADHITLCTSNIALTADETSTRIVDSQWSELVLSHF